MLGKVLGVTAVVVLLALNTYQSFKPAHKESEMRQLFASWKVQYDKSYATIEEEEHRFINFCNSFDIVNNHNAQQRSYTMALNKFADLSHEEFTTLYASGVKVSEDENVEDIYCPSAHDCPTLPEVNETFVNWTAKGAVTGVKNQGMCGSCWSFSTTGSLEGLYFLNNSVLLSFSEQQIVDCDTTCEACNGCFPYLALEYTSSKGVELEVDYPYLAVQGTCRYRANLAYHVNTGYQCIQQKSASQLEYAVVGQPVSIAVDAGNNAWQYYAAGIIDGECTDSLDHAVLLVGYGEIQNQNAWIVKNSWGEDWGANGYLFISQDATANEGYGVCGILRCAVIATNSSSSL